MTLDPTGEKLARYTLSAPPPRLKEDLIEGVMRRVARRRTMRVLTVGCIALLLAGAVLATISSLVMPQKSQRQVTVAGLSTGWDGGNINKSTFGNATVICTGVVTGTRPVDMEGPLWKQYIYAADLVSYEADFLVDEVIKGKDVIPGSTIHIQYPASSPPPAGQRTWLVHIGFGESVGNKRCMVCLVPDNRRKATYVIVYEYGYGLMGKKQEIEGWDKLTPEQRIAHEFAVAIHDTDRNIYYGAMASAGRTRVSTPELISALRARESDADASVASRAITALLQLNDLRTIYVLPDVVMARKIDPATVGGLDEITAPDAVPALVALSRSETKNIRTAAIYALMQIKSANGAATLAAALDDPDERIHYLAVMGLYNLRYAEDKSWYRPGEGWAPSLDLFRQDPEKTIGKWKQWWDEEGKERYPSVERVLEQYEKQKVMFEEKE